jgi:hypothetical protein
VLVDRLGRDARERQQVARDRRVGAPRVVDDAVQRDAVDGRRGLAQRPPVLDGRLLQQRPVDVEEQEEGQR